MDYPTRIKRDQRLCALRLLSEDPQYSANNSIIQDGLDLYAHRITRSQTNALLLWLESQALIQLEQLNESVWVATLTQAGHDIATGRSTHPDIKKPSPKL